MKFEEVTFIAQNSTHTFYVDGACHFDSTRIREVQLIQLSLSKPIKLYESILEIEVNGIVFECMNVTLNGSKVIGEIKQISSCLYTKGLLTKSY